MFAHADRFFPAHNANVVFVSIPFPTANKDHMPKFQQLGNPIDMGTLIVIS